MMPMMGKTYSFRPITGNYGNMETTECKDELKPLVQKLRACRSVMGGEAETRTDKLKQACCLPADLMVLATLIYLFPSKGS